MTEISTNTVAILAEAIQHYIATGELVSYHTIRLASTDSTEDMANRLATATGHILQSFTVTASYKLTEQVDDNKESKTYGKPVISIIITITLPAEFTEKIVADILMKLDLPLCR